MRSTELHGERRGWNLHLVRRVVRFGRIFPEVWIFRNVWDQFQNFVTDHFSAAAAKREDGVAHQDHAGARLVLMAYFVDPRLLNQFSRSQRAIALIKCFDVGVLQFHSRACFCPSFRPGSAGGAREQLGPSNHGMRSGEPQVGALRLRQVVLLFFFSGNPSRMRQTAALHNREKNNAMMLVVQFQPARRDSGAR